MKGASMKTKSPKQLDIFASSFQHSMRKEHGGGKASDNKRRRPISKKNSMHVVLKARKGFKSFRETIHLRKIESTLIKQARHFQIQLQAHSINSNHLHLMIKIKSRSQFKNFLRALAGIIARIVLQAEKGRARKIKLWEARPFTRIVEWGKARAILIKYIWQNKAEAVGFVKYVPRTRALLELDVSRIRI
jgi:REP element-mobilizing transposase RayT